MERLDMKHAGTIVLFGLLLMLLATAPVWAQEGPPPPPPGGGDAVGGPPPDGPPPPPPPAQQPGQLTTGVERHYGQGTDRFQGLAGTITAITAENITVKTLRGDTATVKLTKDTAFRRGDAEAKLADFKVGEPVFVAFNGGQAKDGSWSARLVALRSNIGGRTYPGGNREGPPRSRMSAMDPAELGKTFVIGEITKIDGAKLTIHRMDGVDQVIAVDDDTSFRNPMARDESVTLADFKVGDRVAARGELKDGAFLVKVLRRAPVARPHMEHGPGGTAQGPASSPAAGSGGQTEQPPPPQTPR